MKVILKERIPSLGEHGDIVHVKPGYGRNYLIPRGLAVVATTANLKVAAENTRQAAQRVAEQREQVQGIIRKLESLSLKVQAKVGEENKIFGTITAAQLTTLLAQAGISVDPRSIHFEYPARTLGNHSAKITLAKEVIHTLPFEVIPAA